MVGETPAYQAAAAIQAHFGFSEIFWMHQRTLRSQTSVSSPFRVRPDQKISKLAVTLWLCGIILLYSQIKNLHFILQFINKNFNYIYLILFYNSWFLKSNYFNLTVI